MYTGKQISLGEVLERAELWDFGVTFPVSIFLEPPKISCLNNKVIILVPEAKREINVLAGLVSSKTSLHAL